VPGFFSRERQLAERATVDMTFERFFTGEIQFAVKIK
jgi:hypothetical protein